MSQVTKAVILAAGRGTRFLPYSKASPKEMIAVVDKPSLQIIVEEIISAGITDILIIDNKDKAAIRKHFSQDYELEQFLSSRNKNKELEIVKSISNMANFTYVCQENATGSGAAMLLAEQFANGQAVAVLNGDDAMYTVDGQRCVIGQLCDCYEIVNTSIVGVQPVSRQAISKYGAINIVKQTGRRYFIDQIIEKPSPEKAPSLMASLGRYILSGDFYDYIRRTPKAANGEYQLTDAINLQAKEKGIYAYDFEGLRYDLGDKLGYLKACVEYGMRHEEIGAEFKKYLQQQKTNI